MILNKPVQMNVNKTEARRSSPVAKQTWFDMFGPQRLLQQRISLQINLSNRQIISSAPITLHQLQACRIKHRHKASSKISSIKVRNILCFSFILFLFSIKVSQKPVQTQRDKS